jgi:hypothetical protein
MARRPATATARRRPLPRPGHQGGYRRVVPDAMAYRVGLSTPISVPRLPAVLAGGHPGVRVIPVSVAGATSQDRPGETLADTLTEKPGQAG